jgi:hypothetical protein
VRGARTHFVSRRPAALWLPWRERAETQDGTGTVQRDIAVRLHLRMGAKSGVTSVRVNI